MKELDGHMKSLPEDLQTKAGGIMMSFFGDMMKHGPKMEKFFEPDKEEAAE